MKFSGNLSYALGVVASVVVLAAPLASSAQNATAPDCMPAHHAGKGMRHSDWANGMQKHLDKLKTDLKIQPNQEEAWQAYTAKIKAQGERIKAFHQQARVETDLPLPERLDRQTDFMKQRQANREEMANTLKTLYATLTPEQRAIMDKHFSHKRHHG